METNYEQILDSPSKNSYIGSYYQPPDTIQSVSRQLEFPEHPQIIRNPPASRHNTPQHRPSIDSKAVVDALKTLQEKIRKLELERKQAQKSYQQFSVNAQKHQQRTSSHTASLTEKDNPTSKEELNSKVQSAVSRCQLLEKQLDYMGKMVEHAKKKEGALMENQVSLQSQHSPSLSQTHCEKLEKLESECLQLSKTQTVAARKLAILELKLQKEEHERKLVQEKAEELQREFDVSLRLPAPTLEETKKTKKTKKSRRECEPASGEQRRTKMPFVAGTSTSPSHSVHANVQSILHMMKHHQPQLCERLSGLHRPGVRKNLQRNFPPPSNAVTKPERLPVDQKLSSLSDLLLALQDELGQMSFEHQELMSLIDATEDRNERKELQKELEKLVSKMEEKGVHITKLRKHQQIVHKMAQNQPSAEDEAANESRGMNPSPVRPKGKKGSATENLQLLRETQKLRNNLRLDDVSWET
ncbi:centrosomal protein CEP57L1 [Gouania willdenowi]|uniref:Centrosomal protein 57kDa-like protein 1 n=1 Tax=Gouania willdenowi TaxID=441366 RepID=A0A8C5G1R0_GOUWI|nr:centrosomal protein CEP57L1 [Gouania willdenowi]